jgi:hypothetical protein
LRKIAHPDREIRHKCLSIDARWHMGMLAWVRRRSEVLQVKPGTECSTRSGENHNLAINVCCNCVERVVKFSDELERNRVKPIGAVEANHRDVRFRLSHFD